MDVCRLSDAEVIARSLADQRAFEVIFDRHFDAVHRFATGRVGSQDAADVASETFARAFDRRHRFRSDRASALPWLFGIAVNVCRERNRRRGRGQRAVTRLATRTEMVTEPFESASAARLDAERLRPGLAAALCCLSDDEYALLLLTSEMELTYREMADALAIPIGTVRSRLARARRKVRAALGEAEEVAFVVPD